MLRCLVCKGIVVFMLVFSLPARAEHAPDKYIQVTGLIHMDSEVSGGENSLAMLAAVAKNAGAEVGIVTDHDTQRVTYGVWPLKKILKLSYSRPSVRKYGISKYLKDVETVDRQTPDFTFLPGIEAVPYYRWQRSPFSGQLTIHNLHRHMLVIGLDNKNQLENLPSVEAGYPSEVTVSSLLPLVWLLPLIISIYMFKLPAVNESYEKRFMSSLLSRPFNLISIPLCIASVLFLLNGLPYREPVVNQYDSEAGALPYQILIDYVNSYGGLTFWAHPEAAYHDTIVAEKGNPLVSTLLKSLTKDGLGVETEPYHYLLNDTRDYTGFAVFSEGKHIVGKPEGLWDDLLMQFVSGNRGRPVWAIAEIDMEHGTDPETASAVQTVFLVREKKKEEYLDALRVGRVYCFSDRTNRWLTIKDYSVISGDACAISGEVITYNEDARLVFEVDLRTKHNNLETVIIKDGKVFARKVFNDSGSMVFPLPEPSEDMGYVRLIVHMGGTMKLVTNPIFIRKGVKP